MFCQNEVSAQTSGNTRQTNPLVCAIKTVGSDVAYVFTSPSRLTTKGGVELLVLSAVTTGFICKGDDKVDEELALEGYEFSAQPFKLLAKLGQVYDDVNPVNFSIGLSATVFAGGLALHDKKLLQTSRLLVESVVLTQLFTATGKGVFGRARPYLNHGPRDFNLFKFGKSENFKSMPSGHVSSAFALMTVIAKQYDHWYVEIPAYTFAASVAFQRMTSRNHWASDSIVGGAIGYWVAGTLVKKQRQPPQSPSLNFYPAGNRLNVALIF
jgi:membrane-associated phospholipid phosphatase